mgnify:FL=1
MSLPGLSYVRMYKRAADDLRVEQGAGLFDRLRSIGVDETSHRKGAFRLFFEPGAGSISCPGPRTRSTRFRTAVWRNARKTGTTRKGKNDPVKGARWAPLKNESDPTAAQCARGECIDPFARLGEKTGRRCTEHRAHHTLRALQRLTGGCERQNQDHHQDGLWVQEP